MSAAPTELQEQIKRSLRKNRTRKRKGFKHRGAEWVKTQQMMCAVAGHVESPFHGAIGRCMYCGASFRASVATHLPQGTWVDEVSEIPKGFWSMVP